MRKQASLSLISRLWVLVMVLAGCDIGDQPAPPTLDITLYLTEAGALSGQGQYSAALNQLNRAVAEAQDNDPRPYLAMGEIYLTQQRWAEAQKAYHLAIERDPQHLAALEGMAEALMGQGKPIEATTYWQKAIRQAPTSSHALLGLGRAHLAQTEYAAAEAAFRQALTYEKTNPETLWYLAALTLPEDTPGGRVLLEQIDSAYYKRNHLEALLANQPAQAEVAKLTGITLIQLDEMALAHHALSLAVEQNPQDAEAWAFLGHTQGHLGLPGLESFQQAAALAPRLALIPYLEGIYLRRRNQPDLAVDRFLKALDLDPNNPGVAVETAQTLAGMGDYLSAEAWYQALVKLEPETILYQTLLTAFYVERGYRVLEKGLSEAEKLVEMSPDSAGAYDLLGWARLQSNDLPGAEEALRRALELDPDNISARFHLGQVLQAQNRLDEAQAEFTRVADQDTSGLFRDRILTTASRQ
jgi:tetratricopeptide (TPR) repeat protein